MVYSKEYNYNLNRYEYIKGVQPRCTYPINLDAELS
jgi:hypothetical protein